MAADVTAQQRPPQPDPTDAIVANLRAAREDQADTAPLTDAEIQAAQIRNASPLTAGVVRAGRTLFGGASQLLAGGNATEAGRAIRRLRERNAQADAAVEQQDVPSQVIRGGAQMAVETLPLIAAGIPENPLAAAPSLLERAAGRAVEEGAQFGAFNAGQALLAPRPTPESVIEAAQSGTKAGVGFGAAGEVLPAGLQAVRNAAEGEAGGAVRMGGEPAPVETPSILEAGRADEAQVMEPPPAAEPDPVAALALVRAQKSLAEARPTGTADVPDFIKSPEAGAAHNDAARQSTLFGGDELAGNAQTEMLPETAGVPTARLKSQPIQPDEMARVQGSATTPAGERPALLFDDPEMQDILSGHTGSEGDRGLTIPRNLKKLSDDDLANLHEDYTVRADRSMAQQQQGRVARKGRMNSRMEGIHASAYQGVLQKIETEMRSRGLDPEDVLSQRAIQAEARGESVRPLTTASAGTPFGYTLQPVQRAIARAGVGALTGGIAGAVSGDTPEERKRRALIGAATGAAALGAGPPLLRIGVEAFKKSALGESILRQVAPGLRTPEAAQAARTLRANLGRGAYDYEQHVEALATFRKVVEPLDEQSRYGFIHAIETGATSQLPKELQPAAQAIRQRLDATRDAIRSLGTGKLDQFIDNYFPHIWDDPAKAQSVFGSIGGRRPFEGPKSFLKQRTIPTTADGLAAGLKPVTSNPIDLTLLKLREMERYLTAQRAFQELKGQGLLQYIRPGATIPDGFARINDNIATVFGPRQGAVTLPAGANISPADVAVQGRRIMGEFWAPEPVANVLNNHLSPGLRGNAVYDLYRGIGNTMNQAQLGLSAFHLGFTSLDAMTSRTALAIRQLRSLDIGKGLLTLASTPAAAITNALKGDKVLQAYLRGTGDPALADMVDGLVQAGGRVRMDSFYRTGAGQQLREMMRTPQGLQRLALRAGLGASVGALANDQHPIRGAIEGAGIGAFGPALLEMAAKPLMEYIVPRQKLGVFADLARYELEKLPAGTSIDAKRKVLQGVWDSVDNRMGQLVYDNLFWNRTLKDLSMASIRSVGWNLGTVRELGGGALDLGRGSLSSKTDYLMALPITVGLLGAVTTLAYTGHGPQTLKDYFLPPTGRVDREGNVERVQLPSYLKDIVAYVRHPASTVTHKLHPELGLVADMLKNENFYGDRIRNEHDPLIQQARQVAGYIATQFVPFGIRNAQEVQRRLGTTSIGQTVRQGAPSFLGVTPAPREDVRTPAQNRLMQYLSETRTTGATPQEQQQAQTRRDLLEGLRSGTKNRGDLIVAIRQHQITSEQGRHLLQSSRENPMLGRFKELTLPEAEEVYKLASPSERLLWRAALVKKRQDGRKAYQPSRLTAGVR